MLPCVSDHERGGGGGLTDHTWADPGFIFEIRGGAMFLTLCAVWRVLIEQKKRDMGVGGGGG